MALSPYRIHRIYIAAYMNFALGSDDQEEMDYHNKIEKEIDDMKCSFFAVFQNLICFCCICLFPKNFPEVKKIVW